MLWAYLLISSGVGLDLDSPELAAAKARAAVAISLELRKESAPRPKRVEELPWVRAYSPDFPCPACERVKADARRGLFPFRLIWGTAPEGFEIECYPAFHWNDPHGHGCRWPPLGNDDAYPGAEKLVAIWRKSQN